MNDGLLTTADFAREVGRTPAAIRAAARDGRIRVAVRTASGQRLFTREELERVKAERATKADDGPQRF
jgi:DNA-binding transcriptional MerR regulator